MTIRTKTTYQKSITRLLVLAIIGILGSVSVSAQTGVFGAAGVPFAETGIIIVIFGFLVALVIRSRK